MEDRHASGKVGISISDAAEQFGVSRRTIERWIRDGRLGATPSEGDRRVRLVNPADVTKLVTVRRRRALDPDDSASEKPATETTLGKAGEKTPAEGSSEADAEYQILIDDALQLVYSHIHRLVSRTCPVMFQPQTREQLRNGPLGRDLVRLARLARGETRESKERVLETIDSVLQLLFWPAAADDYTVPRPFWDTELGRMLAMAKYRVHDPAELVSVSRAAQLLGVTRPTIYRWMDDRVLNYVLDDESGQVFVVRRDIETLKRVAREMALGE